MAQSQSNGFALSELFSPLSGGLRTVNTGVETLRYAGYPGAYVDGHGALGGLERTVQCSICLISALSFGACLWDRSFDLDPLMWVGLTSGMGCGMRWFLFSMCWSTMWIGLFCQLMSCWSLALHGFCAAFASASAGCGTFVSF